MFSEEKVLWMRRLSRNVVCEDIGLQRKEVCGGRRFVDEGGFIQKGGLGRS